MCCFLHELATSYFVLCDFVVQAAVFLVSKMSNGAVPCVEQGVGNSLANTDDLLSVELEFKSYEDLPSVIKSW